ncbi:MAG: UDP-N-acetylmuramoyl-tripeptide--D-alanyl-D-alanine ligase [Dehalococcoidia bacterium]|nr:UDP-N-acetylmuramoyl-tripeptide--D-alanyl-D-alanine ligase [Dehalococcoidia bacterium]
MTTPAAGAPALDGAFVRRALAAQLRSVDGPPLVFTRAVIDSRLAQPGDLFVALRGEHTDGHEFAADALARGAAGVLCERVPPGVDAAVCFEVADALAALQALAVAWRDALPALDVVGVTGNVGKSTTKLIAAAVLAQRYRTQAEPANYNNEIGVPLCLLALRPDTERAVLELGMYTTGEIALLCRWTRPRIGVVLNVGPVHLERAGSLEAIARAKRELPEALPPGGVAVLNADDARVAAMAPYTAARVCWFGSGVEAHVRGDDVESDGARGFRFSLHYAGASRRVAVPLPGRHLLSNVLAALAVGLSDGVPLDEAVGAIETLRIPTRLRVGSLPGGVMLLDDTYNASPVATLGALELLAETPGRHLALLGDMLELGELSAREHARVGRRAAELVDVLFTVGGLADGIAVAARQGGLHDVHHYATKDEAAAALRAALRPGDVLLVKGSRALALETVVTALARDLAGPAEAGR